MFGRTLEKFVNHSPAARDFQTFLVFSQTPRVGYYPYKPTESVVYCLSIVFLGEETIPVILFKSTSGAMSVDLMTRAAQKRVERFLTKVLKHSLFCWRLKMLLKQIMYMTFIAKYQETAYSRGEKSHNKQSDEFKT